MIFTLQINPSLVRFVNQLKSEQWLASVEPTENNRKELVEWIHANTSPTDLFAIAPAMDGFRLWEERPIVVDLKNVPFRAAELKGWSERINSAYTINLLTPFQVPPPPKPIPQLNK